VAGSIAYGGVQLTAPLGLVDTGNNYSANISASQRGIQAACVNRQIYGGIADMPGFNKIFLFGGFGYWDANVGSAAIGCTCDYVAKKYQLLDAETWPVGSANNVTSAVWNSTYGRVLFTTESSLSAYYPGRAQGSRVQIILKGDGCGSDNCSTYTGLGCQAETPAALRRRRRIATMIFRAVGSVLRPAATFSISGSGLATSSGPAVIYDPVGDVYIHSITAFSTGRPRMPTSRCRRGIWLACVRLSAPSMIVPPALAFLDLPRPSCKTAHKGMVILLEEGTISLYHTKRDTTSGAPLRP